MKGQFKYSKEIRRTLNQTISDKFGEVWTSLGKLGQLWATLDKSGQVWTSLDKFGQVWKLG